MRAFGRALQLIGLVILPLAMVLQFLQAPGGGPVLSLWQMLAVMVGGVSAFYIGRLIEGYAIKR